MTTEINKSLHTEQAADTDKSAHVEHDTDKFQTEHAPYTDDSMNTEQFFSSFKVYPGNSPTHSLTHSHTNTTSPRKNESNCKTKVSIILVIALMP